MQLIDNVMNDIFDNTTCELSVTEWFEIESVLSKYIKELDELRNMKAWMEENSNTSLCDYYNRESK